MSLEVLWCMFIGCLGTLGVALAGVLMVAIILLVFATIFIGPIAAFMYGLYRIIGASKK